jgi:hypothetical protein
MAHRALIAKALSTHFRRNSSAKCAICRTLLISVGNLTGKWAFDQTQG